MRNDSKSADQACDDELIELGAASERTQAVGNHGVEPNMEPLFWM